MVTSTENDTNPEMEQKLASQIEYYFSDLNLKHDKFMKNEMNQNDGWFPIEKLMTFNRLKKLTTNKETVIDLIKKSTTGLIELNEDDTKIHRLKPIPEESPEYIKELNLRTLHLKGFPKDSVLDDIMKFCSEFGKVEIVQMRRNFKKNSEFKGCIFVTYASKEDADKVLEPEELKYNDLVLLKENKEAYFERRKKYYDSIKKKRAESEDNLIKTKGAILKVVGLSKDTKFGDVKEELSKHSKVAFVSNVDDQSLCNIRFANEDGAKEALKALIEQSDQKDSENKVSIELCGQKVEISLPTEDEEQAFWKEFQSRQQKSAPHKGKGKWQRNKKRSYDDYQERKNKKNKVGGDV